MNKDTIISKLKALPGDSVFVKILRTQCESNFEGCVKMITDQAGDPKSRKLLIELVGEDVVEEVERFGIAVVFKIVKI